MLRMFEKMYTAEVCVHAVYVMSTHVSSLTKLRWREHIKPLISAQ